MSSRFKLPLGGYQASHFLSITSGLSPGLFHGHSEGKKLIELLETSDIAEIEIKEGEEAVRISRNSSVTTTVAAPAGPRRCASTKPRCTRNS